MSSSNQGERARVAAIDRLGVLDRPSGGRFDPVIRLAQRVFDVPVVAVNVVGADRMHTIDAVGVPCGSVPRDLSFCTYTVDQEQTFVVPDTSRDARFARNPLTRHGFRFYAGHPLTVAGHRIGSLCLVDDHPRSLGAAEEVLLADLARWVEDQMQLEDAEFQAEEVQRRLLPRRKPQVPGYDVAGGNAAARLVSGDYYDWQQLDDGF